MYNGSGSSGSMESARSADRGSVSGYSGETTGKSASRAGSTGEARSDSQSSGSKSKSGSGKSTSSTSSSSSSSSGARSGGNSGSMASARASDRSSVAGYSGDRGSSGTSGARSSGSSTPSGGARSSSATGMGAAAAARSSERSSVAGYSGDTTRSATGFDPGAGTSTAAARAADRASVYGYSRSVSPGFESRSSVPARSVSTQSYRETSTVPGTIADARAADRRSVSGYDATTRAPASGYASSFPTGFNLDDRTRMESVPRTKGFGASVGDIDMAQQRRATENQSMDQLGAIKGILATARKAEARKTDPYNGLVWGGPTTHTNLTDMTVREVMDFQRTMRQKGHQSTAVGAYQTVASTLAEAVQRLGISPDAKFTPAVQDAIATDLVYNRANKARKADGTVDAAQFADQLASEWAGFAAANGRSKYGSPNKATVGYAEVKSAADAALNSGLFGNEYSPASATPAAPEVAGAPEEAAPGTAAVDPTTPTTTPTVEDPTLPKRAPKPTLKDAPPYKRTGFGQVAATGIDVMTSTLGLPGVGAQLASMLFTGKSVGENLIDFAATNENYFQPGEGTDAPDYGDPERLTAEILADQKARAEARKKSTSTVTPKTETFEEKYLGDEVWRPTPEQKWDINSPNYSPKYMGLA